MLLNPLCFSAHPSDNHQFVLDLCVLFVSVLFVCDLLFKKSILATMWRM